MQDSFYDKKEEYANIITHGIGVILSILALILISYKTIKTDEIGVIVSGLVFGFSLFFMYTVSTLYHGSRSVKRRHLLRRLDHVAIYLLIAGTYTPFMLITLKNDVWGERIFLLIWTLALFGIIYKLTLFGRYKRFSLFLYLTMGWLVIFIARPMIAQLPYQALQLIVAGGLSYTVGAVFYRWEKLPFNHAIWHLFVLGGSLSHFFAVFFYVINVRSM